MKIEKPHLDAMLALPPPRRPDDSAVRAFFNLFFPRSARIVLYVLPVFMASAMLVLLGIMFTKGRLLDEWRLLREPTGLAEGSVLKAEKRRGAKGSVTYVYLFEFRPERAGRPVVRAWCLSGSSVAKQGDSVQVEYLRADPSIARIRGCRVSAAPLFTVPVIMLGMLAGIILPIGILRYRRMWIAGVLRSGIRTAGVITGVRKGQKGVTVVEASFGVQERECAHRLTLQLGKELGGTVAAWKDEGRGVTVIADPAKPKRFLIVDLVVSQCG